LEHNKVYTKDNIKTLRYGRIVICCDQDLDGYHCLSLIFNMFHNLWPSLLELNTFISYIRTPLIKAIDSKNKKYKFYSQQEFESVSKKKSFKTIKWYKGLGTSTSEEARECFKDNCITNLQWTGKSCEEAIELAFKKENISDRKTWLLEHYSNTSNGKKIDESATTYDTFINNKLVLFSTYDCIRSIPDVIDGLKPSQRKVLYTMLKKGMTSEIKVAQLGSIASEFTNYHHGENSLNNCIIKMAQDYPGSNNMNLITPQGQFGTRYYNGIDAASPRYIFTNLNKNTLTLFLKQDLDLLEYNVEEGKQIEPVRFYPVLPIVLLNTTIGIGSGFSTMVPSYNPVDIIKNIKLVLNGKQQQKMEPWYKGIKRKNCDRENNNFVIYDIPIGTSISNFKKTLQEKELQLDYTIIKDSCTENDVYFELQLEKGANVDKIKKELKLDKKQSINNMYLFHNGKLQIFKSPEEILNTFVVDKQDFLKRKKKSILKELDNLKILLNYKIKFIRAIISKEIIVFEKTKKDIQIELEKEFPDTVIPILLSMNFYNFSKEEISVLENKILKNKNDTNTLENTSIKQMFLNEIENFEKIN
jgi:DNA topoisomerase-2